MVKPRFVPSKPEMSILSSMKEGIGFIRKQGSMEALMVLAFCMTALGVPMLTFLPVFAKDVFPGGGVDKRDFEASPSVVGPDLATWADILGTTASMAGASS